MKTSRCKLLRKQQLRVLSVSFGIMARALSVSYFYNERISQLALLVKESNIKWNYGLFEPWQAVQKK